MNAPLSISMPAEAKDGPTAYKLLIDGKLVDAKDGRTIERVSPGHGVAVSRYTQAGATEVEAAVTAAHRAFESGQWPRMKGSQRSAILLKAVDLIESRLELIARLDALESGKPIAQARGEIAGAVDIWRYAAALARTLSGESYANLGENMLGTEVVARLRADANIQPGAETPLAFNLSKSVFFDPATENRIA